MKGLRPPNPFGVSGVNSVAAKSNTIEVTGYYFFKLKKKKKNVYSLGSTAVEAVKISTYSEFESSRRAR